MNIMQWNQKFTKQAVEAHIQKKEGASHQYIIGRAMEIANEVKHPSKDSFYMAYRRNK